MSSPIETEVIVIGGSIVGLAASAFLAHRNVSHIMIEKHLGSSPHPRAIGYTMRTVELLRMLGVDSQIPQVGMGGKPRRVKVESLAGKWHNETHWTNKAKPEGSQAAEKVRPSADLADSLSPVGNAAFSQDKMEPILRKRAQELGADHRLGWKMTSWSQDSTGVSVTATNKSNEQIEVRGKYLIAADGPKSEIREAFKISRTGVGYMRTLRSMLFRCEPIRRHLTKGFHQFTIEQGPDFEAFMTSYPDGRWALMTYDISHSALDDAGQRDLIRKAAGEDISDADIELLAHGCWDLSASISDSFQSGRIFYAGDSAHTLPPSRGGFGANTGIADAHDLAWKLAAVLSGESKAELLDTYDAERRPVARTRHDQIFARDDYKDYLSTSEWKIPADTVVIDDISMELGQRYTSSAIALDGTEKNLPVAKTPADWAGQAGTRAAHFWVKKGEEKISILDTFYKGWVVIAKDERWGEAAEQAGQATGVKVDMVHIGKDVFEVESGVFAKAYGIEDSGAALVRPDGYIAWKCANALEDAAASLTEVLAKVAHASKQ